MDTNNKNYDVDTLLQKALSSSEKPDAELIKKIKYELPQKKPLMKKSIIKHSFSSVAAIIVAMLVITTTALAAAGYLGSFDRLRAIIGGERAALIQPIEISNVVGEIITEDGIRVELVAIGVFDNVVDIYLTLEDMVGNRLDNDNFNASFFLDLATADLRGGIRGGGGHEIIDRTDGIITIYSRKTFSQSLTGQDLTFTLRHINYDIRQYLNHEINLYLATATPNAPTAQLILDHDPFSIGMWGTDSEKVRELLPTNGVTILEPNIHNIDLGFENIETLISTIGIIDGRLHIQLYEPSPCYNRNWSSIHLLNPQGEFVELALNVPFSIDEQGNFYVGQRYTHYRENIFIVDLDMLSEYRLFGNFHNSELIELEWTVTFEVENNNMQLVLDGLDLEHRVSTIKEVRLNPFAVLIKTEMAADELALGIPPRLRINTADGVVTAALSMASRDWVDEFDQRVNATWTYDIEGDFLDLDSITSVELVWEWASDNIEVIRLYP